MWISDKELRIPITNQPINYLTTNEKANAEGKLERKNFDMIVLNSLRDKGAGFNFDTNKVAILQKGNIYKEFELKSKVEVAEDIVAEILSLINK